MMTTAMMAPILSTIDRAGYDYVNMLGGAVFDVCVRYLHENPWRRVEMLSSKLSTPTDGFLRGQSLYTFELFPDDIVLIVGGAHPWQGRKQVTIEELRAEPLLLRERGSGTRAALESAIEAAGLDLGGFRVVGEMGSTQAIKQAVKAGVGVSLVSSRAIEEESRTGSVWRLRVKDLRVNRAFYLATNRERSRSPLAEAFRAFVEAEAV